MSEADWCRDRITDLENAIVELGADTVAAFIAEPILASGGVIIPPDGYFKGCFEVCRKFDVLFIADEVVTAFGRLGQWRSDERRVGKEGVSTCRSWGSPYSSKKKSTNTYT